MSNQRQSMPTRREFLRAAATGVALGTLGGLSRIERAFGQSPEAGNLEQPNILVIMSDEHNASVTGCYGNNLANTPNIDSIATRGITFDSCYTASPLCVPARLSFTAGRYISHIGAWGNTCWITNPEVHTLPSALAEAGYQTVLCGKMHYDRSQRYGFNYDMGLRNTSFMTGLEERRNPDDLIPKSTVAKKVTRSFQIGNKNPVITGDLQVTERVTGYLKQRKQGDKPFFMLAGYLAPHTPLIIPERYWLPYKDKVPMPEIPEGFLQSLPRNYQHLRIGFDVDYVPDNLVKLGRELYYGFVNWFDEQVGIVLDALENSEVADNTIVIYTTDHGENMGDHGMWWKNAMWEQAARVPLIVSWPKRWTGGQRRVQACSHLDLVATIAELAGVKIPSDWNGTSMCRWLDNAGTEWKDLAVSQYYAHNIASGYTMVRHSKYKYVYHTPAGIRFPAEHELYDLEADPKEFTNLARQPGYEDIIEKMFILILREIGEHPDQTELRCRAEIARGYGRVKPKGYVDEEDD